MYANGKVYAIICRKTDRRYIGSTCEPTLAKRLAQHVTDFKRWKEGKSRCMSYDIIKDGDYYIILLELYPCNSRDELRMCEQKYIDACECLNKRKAFRNEEELAEYKKQYQEQNRGKISEQHKNKYQQNRDEINKRQKKYREEHRDEIIAKRREKICCPTCQKEITKGNLSKHKKICVKI